MTGIELVKAVAAENREKRVLPQRVSSVTGSSVVRQARHLPYLLIGLTIAATLAHGCGCRQRRGERR